MARDCDREWACSVYAISDGIGNVKFGVAKNVQSRLKSLQTGNAHPLQLLFVVDCVSTNRWQAALVAHALEREIHEWSEGSRMSGEWFAIDYHAAYDAVNFCMEQVAVMPWQDSDNVRIDGVFVYREEKDHIWYWPTNDVHARGLISE